jgi:nucleoside 2-deoxyribosyltransferase
MIMKRIFLAYSIEPKYIESLKERIKIVTACATKHGIDVYAHVRDDQKWNYYSEPAAIVLDKCFKQIAMCDMFIADCTLIDRVSRNGINIESGYAKALDKKIWGIIHNGDRPHLLYSLFDVEIDYSNLEELNEKLAIAFKQNL